MTNKDFTLSFWVPQSPQEAYAAINNVPAWWSADFTGASEQEGDEFEVRFFDDVHYSRHRLEEAVPAQKIMWLTTDSRLSFLQNKAEWTGTRVRFEIREEEGRTKVLFVHEGLHPEAECFRDCSTGWAKFILHSLRPLITTGKGNLDVLKSEPAATKEIFPSNPLQL